MNNYYVEHKITIGHKPIEYSTLEISKALKRGDKNILRLVCYDLYTMDDVATLCEITKCNLLADYVDKEDEGLVVYLEKTSSSDDYLDITIGYLESLLTYPVSREDTVYRIQWMERNSHDSKLFRLAELQKKLCDAPQH